MGAGSKRLGYLRFLCNFWRMVGWEGIGGADLSAPLRQGRE